MHYRILSDCIVTPEKVLDKATVEIDGKHVAFIDDRYREDGDVRIIDMRGNIIVPAFINAHDHFLGTWLPKVGRGNYDHWAQWNADLKTSTIMTERSKTTDYDRYLLGSYKAICSGATTVSDHIPHEVINRYVHLLPIRLITEFTLSHAVSELRLIWGDNIVKEYECSKGEIPFVTHSNEGFDVDTKDEIQELYRLGVLQENTVLIHGISLTDDDIELLAAQGVSLVWCPNSNIFLFNVTANIPKLLKAGVNVALGTDSCATGGLNLMAELQKAKELVSQWDFGSISDVDYLKMATINAAKAFLIDDRLGSLQPGKLADLLVLKRKKDDPYTSATISQPEDIILLTKEGKPLLAEQTYQPLFEEANQHYSRVSFGRQGRLIIGEPLTIVKRVREALGFHKELPFLPFA